MNGWNLVPGYKNIGTKEDVCGGDPTIVGTRLEPIFIASYGLDTIEDFGITKEQYEEAVKWIVQEIKRLRGERDKLIEGLHNYMKELDRRYQKAYRNYDIDCDHHQLGMAEAYEVAERRLRDILKEVGVTDV